MTSHSEDRTEEGIQFAAKDGRRSSQSAGKAIFADAARAVDPALADKIEKTKDWRKGYIEPIGRVVVAGAQSSKGALRIAADGLDAVRRNMTLMRDGTELALRDAFSSLNEKRFETTVVEGKGAPTRGLEVPYRGQILNGDRLFDQLDRWERAGTLEPSCTAALKLVSEHPEWLDLSDKHFALLGAASEMGPLAPLCSWRANVIAVDLPRRHLWERIIATAKTGAGRLYLPTTSPVDDERDAAAKAGADLLVHAPEIRTWIGGFREPFTIGNYVYADGINFVRLAAAVDSLIENLVEARRDVSIAYLATPTDVFAVPEHIADASSAGTTRSLRKNALRTLSGSRLYAPNYDRRVTGENGRSWGISDALVPIQGPNYALAKSLQRWRAILAREEGTLSSANVAPSARTRSVEKNRMLAAAYRGASSFGVDIFEPETSRVLTAALLVHDLRNPKAAANPQTPLDHPYDLFTDAALHGGIWRMPYTARSVLPLGLLIGAVRRSGSKNQ